MIRAFFPYRCEDEAILDLSFVSISPSRQRGEHTHRSSFFRDAVMHLRSLISGTDLEEEEVGPGG